jgi:hypothetical protein
MKYTVRSLKEMTKLAGLEELKKREKIQQHFWNEVGSVEHISLPKLKNEIEKEFKPKNDIFVKAQIKMMQTEKRVKTKSKVKDWVKMPQSRDTK